VSTRLALRSLGLTAVLAASSIAAQACQGDRDVSRFGGQYFPEKGGEGGEGFQGVGGGTPCVGTSLCGTEVHEVRFDVPNIYFVLDRSGSMATLEASGDTRYSIVREAAVDMLRRLGSLINVGAAVFPHGDLAANPCHAGDEIFPVMAGDPIEEGGGDGPVTIAFRASTNQTPEGGTPISATLVKLYPKLTALEGHTIVMLLTDGGPNCNDAITCTISECQPNIEGQCPPTENCCAVDHPSGGPHLCIDRAATVDAVADIAAAGIEIYVIGITGSQYYGAILDEMAVAAGTAQSGVPLYFEVEDLTTLSDVFAQIAAEGISCELPVADPPEEQGFTNVYLDCDLLPQDPLDGWTWLGDTVVLHGEACAKLKSGAVTQVQVITGCPTEVPR
jgi:hypothetical protein